MVSGHNSPLVDALEVVRHGSDDSFSQRSSIGASRGLGTPWMMRKGEFEIWGWGPFGAQGLFWAKNGAPKK